MHGRGKFFPDKLLDEVTAKTVGGVREMWGKYEALLYHTVKLTQLKVGKINDLELEK